MSRFIILLCLLSAAAKAEVTTVTIYVDGNYAPLSYGHQYDVKGFYNDILKVAFSRMPEYHVNLKAVDWVEGRRLVEKGDAFALAPAYYHGHDWKYLYPYSIPIYTEHVVSVCQTSVIDRTEMSWPSSFIGKRVGSIRGYDGWGGGEFKVLIQIGKIAYEETDTTEHLVQLLAKSSVDCIIIEEQVFRSEIEHQKLNRVDFSVAATVGYDHVYIGYSKAFLARHRDAVYTDFMQAFDNEIYKMDKAGTIEDIKQRYLRPLH